MKYIPYCDAPAPGAEVTTDCLAESPGKWSTLYITLVCGFCCVSFLRAANILSILLLPAADLWICQHLHLGGVDVVRVQGNGLPPAHAAAAARGQHERLPEPRPAAAAAAAPGPRGADDHERNADDQRATRLVRAATTTTTLHATKLLSVQLRKILATLGTLVEHHFGWQGSLFFRGERKKRSQKKSTKVV